MTNRVNTTVSGDSSQILSGAASEEARFVKLAGAIKEKGLEQMKCPEGLNQRLVPGCAREWREKER